MSKLVSENDIKDETWLTLVTDNKITEQPDAHWSSASTFTLYKEDHTVANLLRMKLHNNKLVRFAGYKIPHPTVSNVELTVQTAPIHYTSAAGVSKRSEDSAAAVPDPAGAVMQAIEDVIVDIDQFAALWEKEITPKAKAGLVQNKQQQQQQQQQQRVAQDDDDNDFGAIP